MILSLGDSYQDMASAISQTLPKQSGFSRWPLYVIPVNAFSPSTYLAFLPHLPVAAGKYEQFREAWYLMACRRKGEPRDGIVTSPACSYSRSSAMRCAGCEEK